MNWGVGGNSALAAVMCRGLRAKQPALWSDRLITVSEQVSENIEGYRSPIFYYRIKEVKIWKRGGLE